jgi:hypothetical protein
MTFGVACKMRGVMSPEGRDAIKGPLRGTLRPYGSNLNVETAD